MIVFRCRICDLGNLPADVLTCPQCGAKVFKAQYRSSPEHEPHLQTIAETINFSTEPTKPTTEAKFEVTGSSASLNKQTDSTGKDFILIYEDSVYGIGRPDVECQGSEDADKINFCASNIRLGQDQLSQNVNHDLIVKKTILPDFQSSFGHIFGRNAQDNDKFNPSSFNFFPNPVRASNAEPQHQINFSDPRSNIQSKIQSFPESKRKLKGTGGRGNNSSTDFRSKIRNSSNRNALSENLRRVNEVATQEERTRMEGREKGSAMRGESSSAPVSKKSFVCGECSECFRSEYRFNAHVQSNCDPKPCKCNECPYKCKYKYELKIHQRFHSEENPFRCDQCEYTSKWESNLKKHKARWHGKNGLHFGHLYNCNDGR